MSSDHDPTWFRDFLCRRSRDATPGFDLSRAVQRGRQKLESKRVRLAPPHSAWATVAHVTVWTLAAITGAAIGAIVVALILRALSH